MTSATSVSGEGPVCGAAPKRRATLIERELPDELILYDPQNDQVYLLNQVSAAIWDLCDGGRSLKGIAEQLAGRWDVAAGQLTTDVASTVSRFHEDGLLEKG